MVDTDRSGRLSEREFVEFWVACHGTPPLLPTLLVFTHLHFFSIIYSFSFPIFVPSRSPAASAFYPSYVFLFSGGAPPVVVQQTTTVVQPTPPPATMVTYSTPPHQVAYGYQPPPPHLNPPPVRDYFAIVRSLYLILSSPVACGRVRLDGRRWGSRKLRHASASAHPTRLSCPGSLRTAAPHAGYQPHILH